jgi:oligopeptide/dipeptide ABC transporter ATP-binding protein
MKTSSDRLAIIYLGKIVESAPSHEIYNFPRHPYTQSLLSPIPIPDPKSETERMILQRNIPNPDALPSGRAFRTRCQLAEMIEVGEKHCAACHMI